VKRKIKIEIKIRKSQEEIETGIENEVIEIGKGTEAINI
jgi:hypothetical protein